MRRLRNTFLRDQFHLGVQAALVAVSFFRVVVFLVLLYVGENPSDVAVVRLDHNLAQKVFLQLQLEVQLVEGSRLDFLFLGDVADIFHPEQIYIQIPGLQGVITVIICGYSYGSTFEKHVGIRERVSGFRIGDTPFYSCTLRI